MCRKLFFNVAVTFQSYLKRCPDDAWSQKSSERGQVRDKDFTWKLGYRGRWYVSRIIISPLTEEIVPTNS